LCLCESTTMYWSRNIEETKCFRTKTLTLEMSKVSSKLEICANQALVNICKSCLNKYDYSKENLKENTIVIDLTSKIPSAVITNEIILPSKKDSKNVESEDIVLIKEKIYKNLKQCNFHIQGCLIEDDGRHLKLSNEMVSMWARAIISGINEVDEIILPSIPAFDKDKYRFPNSKQSMNNMNKMNEFEVPYNNIITRPVISKLKICAAGVTRNLWSNRKIKGLKVIKSTRSDKKRFKFDTAFNYKKVDLDKSAQLTQSAAAIVMKPVIQQYLNSPNPSSLGEKVIMVLTSKVAQILWN
ncbi:18786_t:CDS:2, partial [Funneliformis geosporum]